MENFQQLMYLSSIAFCGGWFLFAPGLVLFSPAAPKLRSFGIMFGSLALGAASLAHVIMALFRNGIGWRKVSAAFL